MQVHSIREFRNVGKKSVDELHIAIEKYLSSKSDNDLTG
jgi:hypothetical protein